MLKNLSLATLLTAVFSFQASAALLVEQYNGFWSSDVNALITYADNNAATASGMFEIIDFTDDPAGFAGAIPGSNPWPSAAAAGISGTGHSLNNTFFARITGQFNTSAADTYYFQTYNDDGVFVFIDGELVINDPFQHGEARFEGNKFLNAGTHSVELYFFENGGEASLEFTVADSSRNFSHWGDSNGPVSLEVSEPASIFAAALALLGLARIRRKA